MTARAPAIAAFLAHAGWADAARRPLARDASFRHYDRLDLDGRRAVLMDAPPEHEDVRPFMAVARHLLDLGLSAPRVLAADIPAGLLLLEDLGDTSFNRRIAETPGEERRLYEAAVDLLARLHTEPAPARLPVDAAQAFDVPDYDAGLLETEADLLPQWYLPALTGTDDPAWLRDWRALWRPLFPLVWPDRPIFVLRDYHADNLMWLADRAGLARLGLLDFQDATRGHPAYDLVSLLQDARRDVPPDLEQAMIRRYLDASGADEAAFRRAYKLLGAQRNAKIVGIFTRLWRRDGKPHYLALIPRVWGLLERNLDLPELADLKAWLDGAVPADARRRVLNG